MTYVDNVTIWSGVSVTASMMISCLSTQSLSLVSVSTSVSPAETCASRCNLGISLLEILAPLQPLVWLSIEEQHDNVDRTRPLHSHHRQASNGLTLGITCILQFLNRHSRIALIPRFRRRNLIHTEENREKPHTQIKRV